ncbi:radical SAM family RiPP maturation amino acid epimerase [Mesorhizobium sp. ISC15]|uniref:radical SAM family RiPP maturation amino acid epimerase n=1 Tax=Mesorhizobium sp. ISC15 TaxID=3076429 RepID=UPI003FA6041B
MQILALSALAPTSRSEETAQDEIMLSGLQGAASGAHLYPLAEHWRQILNRRTPEERRTLSHVKRFMERLAGDGKFRTALAENLDAPRALTERYGIEVDPLEMLPLWCGDYLKFRIKPESASWPLAMLWNEYMREISHHRDLLRDQGEMSMIDIDFMPGASAKFGTVTTNWANWRRRSRFGGPHWLLLLGHRSDRQPDYDRFLLDYHQITGALPQTTTAAPLKDEALTRRVLELFKRFGGVTNRFSVLSTKHLNQIHAAFSPEDLIGVELILQGKAAPTAKAFVGRARARKEKFKTASKDDATALPEGYPTTIACVSGFLVNMRQGRLQLVTPVPGSERWPLGYRIVGQRLFRTPDEFREGLQSIIDEHMLESPSPNLPIRFRGGLQYEAGYRYFHLRSRNIEYRVLDDVVPISVGELIACGNCTASELIMRVTTDGASALAVADMLDQLYAVGVIEEDLDEVSLGTTLTV